MTRISDLREYGGPSSPRQGVVLGVACRGVSTQQRKSYDLDSLERGASKWKLQSYGGKNSLGFDGDSHLLTVAPTGSGKGRSVIIPNLLSYDGPIVVTDPKGENYAVTARARRELGHAVFKLDPFGVVGEDTDSLNPLDIFDLPGAEIETDSQMIADLLSLENTGLDSFWDINAMALLSGIVAYIATTKSRADRNFTELTSATHSDDVVYNLAVVLDTVGKQLPKMAYGEISAFLQKADKERSGVLSTANSYLKAFMSAKVRKSLDSSSFALDDIVAGRPLSIYLIVPPDKLKSHKALLRLWVGTIMRAITSRRKIPSKKTLFILDECAQLGHFTFLESAITLCRGYGLQTWTFWQDLSQIAQLYDIGWQTMVNNCGVIQIFGAKNHRVVCDVAELIGVELDDLRRLDASEQVTVIDGIPMKSRKLDYLKDAGSQGHYDPNPYYDGQSGI